MSDGYNRERGRRRRGRDRVLYSRVKRQGEAMPDPGARSRMRFRGPQQPVGQYRKVEASLLPHTRSLINIARALVVVLAVAGLPNA